MMLGGGPSARTLGARRWRYGSSCYSCSRTRSPSGPLCWSGRPPLPLPPASRCRRPCRRRRRRRRRRRLPRRRPRCRRRRRGGRVRCRRSAPCSTAAAAGQCWETRCSCAGRSRRGLASSSASVSASPGRRVLKTRRCPARASGRAAGLGPGALCCSASLFLLRSHQWCDLGRLAVGRPRGNPPGMVRSSRSSVADLPEWPPRWIVRPKPAAPPACARGFSGAWQVTPKWLLCLFHTSDGEIFCRDVVFTWNQDFCCYNLCRWREKHSSNAVEYSLTCRFLSSLPSKVSCLKHLWVLVGLVGFWLVWFGFWGRGGYWLVRFS